MYRSRRSSNPLVMVAVVVLLSLIAAMPAAGQSGNGEQVREYIEKTGDLIAWARDLVAETESGPARRVLQNAVDLHRRSSEVMAVGRAVQALETSRRARDAAYHSVRLAREAMGLEERIRIRADRFGDEHRQLVERAREHNHRQALELLDRARRKADRAREQYHQGDFKLAWKMLEQAGDLNRRAARLLADAGGPDRLERELERTAELIRRITDEVSETDDPRAADLLAQARETLIRARRAREQGRPGQALKLAGAARQLAHRAASQAGVGPRENDVRRQIERFDERRARTAERIRETGSDRARDFLARAEENRIRAEEHLAAGEIEPALRRIRAAHDLLKQAEDLTRL